MVKKILVNNEKEQNGVKLSCSEQKKVNIFDCEADNKDDYDDTRWDCGA